MSALDLVFFSVCAAWSHGSNAMPTAFTAVPIVSAFGLSYACFSASFAPTPMSVANAA